MCRCVIMASAALCCNVVWYDRQCCAVLCDIAISSSYFRVTQSLPTMNCSIPTSLSEESQKTSEFAAHEPSWSTLIDQALTSFYSWYPSVLPPSIFHAGHAAGRTPRWLPQFCSFFRCNILHCDRSMQMRKLCVYSLVYQYTSCPIDAKFSIGLATTFIPFSVICLFPVDYAWASSTKCVANWTSTSTVSGLHTTALLVASHLKCCLYVCKQPEIFEIKLFKI